MIYRLENGLHLHLVRSNKSSLPLEKKNKQIYQKEIALYGPATGLDALCTILYVRIK